MSQLFRKEAMERRSRALFGEVRLRSPLGAGWTGALVLGTLALLGFILLGLEVRGGTVWEWLRGSR